MRADEFISEDEKLDEIVPLIAKGLGSVAKYAAKKAVGGVAGSVAGAAAKGIVKGLTARDDDEEKPRANPNAKVGTQPNMGDAKPQTAAPTQPGAAQKTQGAQTMGANPDIKPGKSIELPTNTVGAKTKYQVKAVRKGAGGEPEVELQDPKDPKGPKYVYKQKDIERAAQA